MVKEEIKFISDTYPVHRIPTGLWSFDRALGFRGENGVPLRSLFELYGYEASGKSTLSWYISAKVNPKGTVWIADLEGTLEEKYITEVMRNAGFEGTIRVADYVNTDKRKAKLRSHEEQLQDAIDAILTDEVSAAVVDSIGMFWPIVDSSKDLGERSVGQRAKTIADASRRIAAWLRITEEPKLVFYINHVQQIIGGRGFTTPGGQTKNYTANIRVWLQRIDNDFPVGFLAEARVQKLKFGGANPERKGLVFFIPGFGVSKEMTDVFDCVGLELAERGATVKLRQFNAQTGKDETVSMGRIGDLIEKAQEPEKHKALFANFAAALERYETNANDK
jgi:RecA/RadA recombinase